MAKRGRPKKPASERKAVRIDLRVDGEERDLFQQAADAAGIKLSEWIRIRLGKAAERELAKRG